MTQNFSGLLNEYFNYLKRPVREMRQEKLTFKTLLNIVGIHYIFLIGAAIVLSVATYAFGLDDLPHAIEDMVKNTSKIKLLLSLVIIAPLIEELLFRFPLKFRRGSLFILLVVLSILVYYVFAVFVPDTIMENVPQDQKTEEALAAIGQTNLTAMTFTSLFFILGMVFLLALSFSKDWLNNIGITIDRNYGYFFFITAMLFGYVHIMNFTGGGIQWFHVPFLILPQFVMGLFFGFTRLKFGMWSNIFLHAINNLLPGLVLIFAPEAALM